MGKISSHYDVVAEFYYKAHNEQLLNEWERSKDIPPRRFRLCRKEGSVMPNWADVNYVVTGDESKSVTYTTDFRNISTAKRKRYPVIIPMVNRIM
jgi:hypothetical protein